MGWPVVDQVVHGVDWSWYQNDGTPARNPIDVVEFCDANPDVEVFLIRAVWPSGVVDRHFGYYFDQLTALGKKVGAYVWPNATKTPAENFANWEAALDGRVPRVIMLDFELTWYQPASVLTRQAELNLLGAEDRFPSSRVIGYTAAWWWNRWITPGLWVYRYDWVVAHYPFFVQGDDGTWRQAYYFTEVDPLLPIDNNFTPRLPNGISYSSVVGWQFSEKGRIYASRSSMDLDYFKSAWVDDVFGPDEPQEEYTQLRLPLMTVQELHEAIHAL